MTVRGRVRLGNGVRVGAYASLLGFNHSMEPDAPVYRQPLTTAGITVGSAVDGIALTSPAIGCQ